MNLPSMKDAKVRTNNKSRVEVFEIDKKYQNVGKGKKYYIKTYGCQMNVHDSENIKALLEQMSFVETDNMEDADLILLNTFSHLLKMSNCSVRFVKSYHIQNYLTYILFSFCFH